jgi:predicted ABC-type ATPase
LILLKLRDYYPLHPLASRTFAPWIKELLETGDTFHLVFLWLPDEDFAIARVVERVRMGGHDVPEETIRRRYHNGIRNFFKLYRPLADLWVFYDNSGEDPRLVAYGERNRELPVNDSAIWHNIKKHYASKNKET